MGDGACATCCYWAGEGQAGEDGLVRTGQCRRHAGYPALGAEPFPAQWPITHRTEWCGDWGSSEMSPEFEAAVGAREIELPGKDLPKRTLALAALLDELGDDLEQHAVDLLAQPSRRRGRNE